MRTKKGKLECTPRIFASFSEASNMRNAVTAIAAATTNSHDPIQPAPATVSSSPVRFTTSAASSHLVRSGFSPRKTVIHFALKPQTKGTRNPPRHQCEVALVEQMWKCRRRRPERHEEAPTKIHDQDQQQSHARADHHPNPGA